MRIYLSKFVTGDLGASVNSLSGLSRRDVFVMETVK
jgi:hypothetical protein